jgi:PAS domain S-box-containing protein
LAEAEALAAMGGFHLDLDAGAGTWSDGAYRIHGYEPGEVEPSVEMFLDHIHPDDRDRMRALLTVVVERPDDIPAEGITAEYRAVRPDESVRDVRFRGRIQRDGDDRPVAWFGVVQDVTEQRLTERELHAHYAVEQALREWESFDEGVVDLLRRLGTALDFPVGVLWALDDVRECLVPRAIWRAPEVDVELFESVSHDTAYSPGQGIPGLVWATGQPFVTNDLSPYLTPARRKVLEQLGLRSTTAFAAIADEGPVAVLSFSAFAPRPASDRLMRTLTGIGRELGRFLAARRGELGTRRLTDRELQVLQLAAEGMSGPEIAEKLFVSPATIKTHFQHVYEKLGVGDRAGAVARALRTGLIR